MPDPRDFQIQVAFLGSGLGRLLGRRYGKVSENSLNNTS
jgi:hypothetical protein